MNGPTVSVVIPSYNAGHLVTQAIASVRAQTVPASEVIVVDDGSTDDTASVIEARAHHVRYIRQANQGVSAARNRGIREAAGELVAFLDADDVWHPRKLEIQLPFFRERPALGLLGTGSFDWPAPAYPEVSGAPRLTPIRWHDLAVKNRLATSSVVARRSALDRAGGFDTELQGPEDRDLWIRVAQVAEVANLDQPLMGYRSDVSGSVSKQAGRCQAGMLRILRKLDEQGAWRGRRLMRRKAFGYLYHACAFLHAQEGSYGTALRHMLVSFAWYPMPFRASEVRTPFERPKRLAVVLIRQLSLGRPATVTSRSEGGRFRNPAGPLAPAGSGRAFAESPAVD